MPAMLAAPRLVRSIRLTQYISPTVVTRRRSTRFMMLFCSSSVKPKSSGEAPCAGWSDLASTSACCSLSEAWEAVFSGMASVAMVGGCWCCVSARVVRSAGKGRARGKGIGGYNMLDAVRRVPGRYAVVVSRCRLTCIRRIDRQGLAGWAGDDVVLPLYIHLHVTPGARRPSSLERR